MILDVLKIAAFSDGAQGGNPAGVWIGDTLPQVDEMQQTAHAVGFSETVFACPQGEGWRVRYFSPETEVPFCGHATIALGAALSLALGDGEFHLALNNGDITVSGRSAGSLIEAALQSPPTRSGPASDALVAAGLALFGYSRNDLDPSLPPALINGGATHLILALDSRAKLSQMRYELDAGRRFMTDAGLVTVLLVFAEGPTLFHTRNPFASGGVYEDPATGAATAAFAGYLRDLQWPHEGCINIVQGEDMGSRSRLQAQITDETGASIRVSGTARLMLED
ncbi:PhzF family phenazine biosynthesis isomerase [Pseudomonas sp. CCM 7891]|uniref:PhzF family phenazine biosynthesis isomerase n=1 Tax=Pseudomonas karstica TaxID=1055468 RepID=A0A7X2RPA1_9PSED|nr:PhzF family phenazine biosynthesis protein [Pseudomonas karstica]MTD18066.1 PhzF family phenazine biosynthesis isomerase [Pseudomonas karstica]